MLISLVAIVNYLITYRLQWGKQDTLCKLRSRFDPPDLGPSTVQEVGNTKSLPVGLPKPAPGAKTYFTADIPPELVSIIQNDWPYSGRNIMFSSSSIKAFLRVYTMFSTHRC